MLIDIDEAGGMREMHDIDYREHFDKKWNEFTKAKKQAINLKLLAATNKFPLAFKPFCRNPMAAF